MNFNYFIPTKILFGKGQLLNLHKQQLPWKKALIIISCGTSVKKYGYLSKLEQELKKSNIDYILFDKILPNPIKTHVIEAAQIAKENNCDFIIGLGGGSSIDAAKAIAIMSSNDGDLWDYFAGGTAKNQPIKNEPLPVVAITTTAGTGTEADPWMVITNSETNEKIGFGSQMTFPVLSIVDPELMISVPPNLTAYQGFDALFHSIEGYLNKIAYPISDIYALKSIELIGKSLPKAVNHGTDINARTDMALANTISGMVESTSCCTSEHAIEHALSGLHSNLAHGAGLIMISKEYYTFFAKSGVCDERMIQMAKALGDKDASDSMDFIKALEKLQAECGVNELKMSYFGIEKSEFSKIIKLSREVGESLYAGDPVVLTDDDVMSILEKSYK